MQCKHTALPVGANDPLSRPMVREKYDPRGPDPSLLDLIVSAILALSWSTAAISLARSGSFFKPKSQPNQAFTRTTASQLNPITKGPAAAAAEGGSISSLSFSTFASWAWASSAPPSESGFELDDPLPVSELELGRAPSFCVFAFVTLLLHGLFPLALPLARQPSLFCAVV